MTVDDVVYSLNRIRDPKLGSYVGWMLGERRRRHGARRRDRRHHARASRMRCWSTPSPPPRRTWSTRRSWRPNGDKYGTPAVGSIGTGPFKFVEWVSGDHQTLARFDDYWDKANGGPYLDTVTIKILPEPTTRVAGLETGEIDYLVNNVPSDQYATVKAHGQRQPDVRALVLRRVDHLQHAAAAPFDNVKVRQALNYAVDKAGHPRSCTTARTRPDTKATLVYPTMWTFDQPAWQAAWDALPAYDQDLEKAKQLLEESGVADQLNGKTISYYESTPSIKGIGESFIDSMSKLGIDIEAQKVTYQEAISLQFGATRRLRHLRRARGARTSPIRRATCARTSHRRTSWRVAPTPRPIPTPPSMRLLPQQNALADKTERAKLLIQAQGLIAEDVPGHLGHQPGLAAGGQQAGPGRDPSARSGTGARCSRTCGSPSSRADPRPPPERTRGAASALTQGRSPDGGLRRTQGAGRHPRSCCSSRSSPSGSSGWRRATRCSSCWAASAISPQLIEQLRDASSAWWATRITQYVAWLGRAVQVDLGESYKLKQEVSDLILARLPVTFELILFSVLLAVVVAIPLGVYQATGARTRVRLRGLVLRARRASARRSTSRPSSGVLVFAVWLGWLPAFGRGGPDLARPGCATCCCRP